MAYAKSADFMSIGEMLDSEDPVVSKIAREKLARLSGSSLYNLECSNCRYFEADQLLDNTGICRRYPPKCDGCFPDVHVDTWCGEFTREATLENE